MSIEKSYMKLMDVLKELGYEKVPSDVKHLDVYQSKKNKTFEIYVKRHYDTYVETEKNFKVDFGITYRRLNAKARITKVEKGETPESFFDRLSIVRNFYQYGKIVKVRLNYNGETWTATII